MKIIPVNVKGTIKWLVEGRLVEQKPKENTDKVVLDACCGGRMMWFDKKNKNTIYMDIRQEKKGTIKCQPNWSVEPDVLADYRDLPFKDKSFKHILWDVPHMLGKKVNGIIQTKYGFLDKDTYAADLKAGFKELWRCLDDYGTLCFKYADVNVPLKEILALFPEKPLHGTPTKKGVNNTFFIVFMKVPMKEIKTEP